MVIVAAHCPLLLLSLRALPAWHEMYHAAGHGTHVTRMQRTQFPLLLLLLLIDPFLLSTGMVQCSDGKVTYMVSTH